VAKSRVHPSGKKVQFKKVAVLPSMPGEIRLRVSLRTPDGQVHFATVTLRKVGDYGSKSWAWSIVDENVVQLPLGVR